MNKQVDSTKRKEFTVHDLLEYFDSYIYDVEQNLKSPGGDWERYLKDRRPYMSDVISDFGDFTEVDARAEAELGPIASQPGQASDGESSFWTLYEARSEAIMTAVCNYENNWEPWDNMSDESIAVLNSAKIKHEARL